METHRLKTNCTAINKLKKDQENLLVEMASNKSLPKSNNKPK